MKTMARIAVLFVVTALAATAPAQFSLLHEFNGGGDGAVPQSTLVASGSTLYGLTATEGPSWNGTAFKLNTDGSAFTTLRSFTGSGDDAGWMYDSSLILSGSTLYGMSEEGGDWGSGTVFKMNTSGGDFALLHEFAGGANDGRSAKGHLTLSGSTLYGTTLQGGDNNLGTVFKINTDSSGFSLLHEFAGGVDDGRSPYRGLTLYGSTLYGVTYQGGDNGLGTLFKIETDGSGYSLLREFAGGGSDGANPYGTLVVSGSSIYGSTVSGGDNNLGTVFKINTDGSGFSLLHEFSGGAGDGAQPYAGLALSGSSLFGTTYSGGDGNGGVVFEVSTNGTGYTIWHEFAGGGNDGFRPMSVPLVLGQTLYGTTEAGGDWGKGTVFKLVVPEPCSFALLPAGALGLLLFRRRKQPRQEIAS